MTDATAPLSTPAPSGDWDIHIPAWVQHFAPVALGCFALLSHSPAILCTKDLMKASLVPT